MRRRIPWIAAVAVMLVMSAILYGCGSKDAASIVKDLDKVMDRMESYQGSGTMTLHTGQQPLNYRVEVLYQKPNYYRIALTNEKRDITQIVLRNDDGVFILTPSLNKSFRFKSDWPENQGQVYLYQTLVKSIQLDNSRQFTTDKDTYVFDVMASNYNNGSFARQKIWLSKDDYAPRHVEVTDPNHNVMVEVKFDTFEFGKKFESSAFDMKSIMNGPAGAGDDKQTGGTDSAGQTSGQTDEQTSASPEGDGETAQTAAADEELTMVEPDPDALPDGVSLIDGPKDVQLGDTMGVMLRYGGTYSFTILERVAKPDAQAMSQGIMLDLGFTMGQLSGDGASTLIWSYDGVEYRLTTEDLPQEDMVRIAQSMADASGK
jgi:outer membrane lipoprotein-sorting protein